MWRSPSGGQKSEVGYSVYRHSYYAQRVLWHFSSLAFNCLSLLGVHILQGSSEAHLLLDWRRNSLLLPPSTMLGVHLTLVRSALCKSDSTIASRRAFSISSALGSDGLPANGPYDVLFCGSDKFASTILQYLGGYGKGSAWKSLTLLVPTAVAQSRPVEPASTTLAAKDLGISIHEMPPEGIPSTEDSARWELPQRHRSVNPHSLLITASFGQMIPNWMLDRFTAETSSSMALNVHPSMLPHLRGAAPIQWAIARRLADTGVSIQQLSRGTFDQGHILAQMPSDIPQGSTYTSLMPTLARKGAELLLDTIINLPQRHLNAQQQDSAKATLAPKLDPRRAEIDWHQMTAEDIEARFRAFGPSVSSTLLGFHG